ncbi:MAG: hypothetical protein AAGJ37_00780 [Pseudomonadota bacterium]
MEEFGPHFSVFLISMVKFLGGPALGPPLGLHLIETAIMTTLGMMTTVIAISSFGPRFRAFLSRFFKRKKKLFTKGNRRFVVFWRKYGIFGISFLTPVLFSPVFGALLVNTVGGSTHKIYTYMLLSAVFWSVLLAGFSTTIVQSLGF